MDGSRCICRYNGHDGGHRYSGGGFGKGYFEPQDIADRAALLRKQIEEEFISQYYTLYSSGQRLGRPPEEDIVKHRRESLTADTTIVDLWCKLHSYKTCFSCLRNAPDYCLPCGHAICESCVVDFGTAPQERESEIILDRCVLCLHSWKEPQVIQMKPRCAGVRLLTLDGGGVRGILEIAMLLKVEERIGLGLRIPELFDLAIGTSTGGIIALGIAMKDLKLADLMANFKRIATETFKNNRAPKNKVMQTITEYGLVQKILLSTRIWESIYATEPLKKELQRTLDSKLAMFSAARTTGRQRLMRVAVTAVKNDGRQPTIIANYNHYNRGMPPGLPYNSGRVIDHQLFVASDTDLERAEDQAEEMMAWEAYVG
ncbi:MAG: hypothetical protein M1813_002065 [Trichoglossum hirsutum]|nr:MAG: hypothetical protein M1813_002065 [Trichoglossum hirsutum]